MALQSLSTIMAWPGMCENITSAPALTTITTLDAAGEYECIVYCAERDMVVSHVGFRHGTATGSPVVDIRIETVGTDGLPTGTLFGTDTNASSGTLTTNSNVFVALTAAATITKGQMFAVKVLYTSGTSATYQYVSGSVVGQRSVPYRVVNTGTPTKGALSAASTFLLGSSSTAFYPLDASWPASAVTNSTFNNTSGARRGLRFQVPFKCRCVGIRWFNTNSTGDLNIALFDDAGTELSSSSTAFDGDQQLNATNSHVKLYFDNAVTLSPATWYRAALEPTSATNINLSTVTLPAANRRQAMPCGENAHYTTYASSAWTDTATDQVPFLDILIDQLDDGVGGTSARVIGG